MSEQFEICNAICCFYHFNVPLYTAAAHLQLQNNIIYS